MCGRIVQSSGPLRLAIVEGLNAPDSRFSGLKPRYNGAPSQELLVIRENHETGQRSLDLLRWGLIPHGCDDPVGGRRPINAKAETVGRLPTFRDAYARRRCIIPIDGFFEWHATREGRRPYAIAMRDGSPFAVGGLWENWKSPATGQWIRTFCIITTPANVMVSRIHDRMPLILARADLERWLGAKKDPADLLRSYPSADMKMWPISMRVNSPNNDDPSILEPAAEPAGV
jgi:putative SOS response-associated peptidase YedK